MIKTCKREHIWDNEKYKQCNLCQAISNGPAKKKWRLNNLEKDRKYKREYAQINREKTENSRRKCRYGIGPEEYKTMVDLQDGKCAICKIAPLKDIDHCHLSNKVRGLLCHPCNLLLGNARDNPEILRWAADYLESNQ